VDIIIVTILQSLALSPAIWWRACCSSGFWMELSIAQRRDIPLTETWNVKGVSREPEQVPNLAGLVLDNRDEGVVP
jgi:hypothetical protein